MPDTLPNFVIFVPDEMRGDLVGNPAIRLPNLDALRQDGHTFAMNFTANPVCTPSRICTFTGQFPQNGAHRSLYQLLKAGDENLFRLLKQKGYHVQYIGRNDLFTPASEAESVSARQGSMGDYVMRLVQQALAPLSPEDQAEAMAILQQSKSPFALNAHPKFRGLVKLMRNGPWPAGHRFEKSFYFGEVEQSALNSDQMMTDLALQFLENPPQEPFCLYIGLSFPHPPYEVREPYFSMYDRNKVPQPVPPNFENMPTFMEIMHKRYGLDRLSAEDYREIVATYYGMTTQVDDQLGQVLSKLKEKGVYENTAVVFFSDHGDYTGDYGLTEKWPTAFQDCLTRVPLVVKLPGESGAHQTWNTLTQSIDLFPTILELAQVQTPYTHFGQSLLPLMRGERPDHRDAVFSVGGYNLREPQCFEDAMPGTIYGDKTLVQRERPETAARSTMIRTREWKMVIRQGEKEELYDLVNDPKEQKNLIDDPGLESVRRELRDRLLYWYLNTSDNPHWERSRAL